MKQIKEANEDMTKWGIEFSSDVVKANATVLAPITVQFGNTTTTNTERGWTNSLRNGAPLQCTPLVEWLLVYGPRDEPKARMFSDEVCQTTKAFEFPIDRAQFIRLPDTRGSIGMLFAQAIKVNYLSF